MLLKTKKLCQKHPSNQLFKNTSLALDTIATLSILCRILPFLPAKQLILLSLIAKVFHKHSEQPYYQRQFLELIGFNPFFSRLPERVYRFPSYSRFYYHLLTDSTKLSYFAVYELLRNIKSIIISLRDSNKLKHTFWLLWQTCNKEQKVTILNAVTKWGNLSLVEDVYTKFEAENSADLSAKENFIKQIWDTWGTFLPDESKIFQHLFQLQRINRREILIKVRGTEFSLASESLYKLCVNLCKDGRMELANNIYQFLPERKRNDFLLQITGNITGYDDNVLDFHYLLTTTKAINFKRIIWGEMTNDDDSIIKFKDSIASLAKWGFILLSLSEEGIKFLEEIFSQDQAALTNIWNNFYKNLSADLSEDPDDLIKQTQEDLANLPLSIAGLKYMRINHSQNFEQLLKGEFFESLIYNIIKNNDFNDMQQLFKEELLLPFYKPYFSNLDWGKLFLKILKEEDPIKRKSGHFYILRSIFIPDLAKKLDWITKEMIPSIKWQALLQAGFAEQALDSINSYFSSYDGLMVAAHIEKQSIWKFSERDQLSVYTWIFPLLKSQNNKDKLTLQQDMYSLFLRLICLGYIFLAKQIYIDFDIKPLLLAGQKDPDFFDKILSDIIYQSWCPTDSINFLRETLNRHDIYISMDVIGKIFSNLPLFENKEKEIYYHHLFSLMNPQHGIQLRNAFKEKVDTQDEEGIAHLKLWDLTAYRAKILQELDQKIAALNERSDENSRRKVLILRNHIRPQLTFLEFYQIYAARLSEKDIDHLIFTHKFNIGNGEASLAEILHPNSICLFEQENITYMKNRKIFFFNPSNPADQFWEKPAEWLWELLVSRQRKFVDYLFNLLPSSLSPSYSRSSVIEATLKLLNISKNKLHPALAGNIENWLNDKLQIVKNDLLSCSQLSLKQ